MLRLESVCPICCQHRERLQKLVPCGHSLCEACVAKLDSLAYANSGPGRRCPFCRQSFEVVVATRGLVTICFKRLSCMRLKENDIKRCPAEVRAGLLNAYRRNARMLYGDRLVELMRGLSLDEICLNDAQNLKPEDLEEVMPLLASAPKTVQMRSVPMLDDRALRAVLVKCGQVLEHLDITGCSAKFHGDSLAEHCNSLPSLQYLSLAECGSLDTDCLKELVDGVAESLRVLDLSGCRKLERDAILSIASCRNLRRLSLHGMWKLDAKTMIQVLAACTQLQALDVTRCSRMDGPTLLRAVAHYCTELQVLKVGAVADITDEEVSALVMSTVGAVLKELSLADCSEITKVSLLAIEKNCPALFQLDISWCHGISENSLVDMISFMPQLRNLNCRGCRGISNATMFFIAQLVAGRALGIEEAPQIKPRRGQPTATLPPAKPVASSGSASSSSTLTQTGSALISSPSGSSGNHTLSSASAGSAASSPGGAGSAGSVGSLSGSASGGSAVGASGSEINGSGTEGSGGGMLASSAIAAALARTRGDSAGAVATERTGSGSSSGVGMRSSRSVASGDASREVIPLPTAEPSSNAASNANDSLSALLRSSSKKPAQHDTSASSTTVGTPIDDTSWRSRSHGFPSATSATSAAVVLTPGRSVGALPSSARAGLGAAELHTEPAQQGAGSDGDMRVGALPRSFSAALAVRPPGRANVQLALTPLRSLDDSSTSGVNQAATVSDWAESSTPASPTSPWSTASPLSPASSTASTSATGGPSSPAVSSSRRARGGATAVNASGSRSSLRRAAVNTLNKTR